MKYISTTKFISYYLILALIFIFLVIITSCSVTKSTQTYKYNFNVITKDSINYFYPVVNLQSHY